MYIFHIFLSLVFTIKFAHGSVSFNLPTLLREQVPYDLEITNPDSRYSFPPQGFILSISLSDDKGNIKGEAVIMAEDIVDYSKDIFFGFSIYDFKVLKDRFVMKIKFSRDAYGLNFKIRYNVEPTEIGQNRFFNENKNKFILYQRKIELYLPFKFTVKVQPSIKSVSQSLIDKMPNSLLPDKYGLVYCEAKDGPREPEIEFLGVENLLSRKIVKINSRISTVEWMVEKKNHGRVVQCKVGQQIHNVTLNVFHHMTKLTTNPPIVANEVPGDSRLTCVPSDGYPRGSAVFTMVKGPMDKSMNHYQLVDNNSTLLINISAPLYSNWTVECRGSNDIPAYIESYLVPPSSNPINQQFTFIVGKSSNVNRNEDESRRLATAGVSSVGLVFLLLFLFLLVIAMALFCKMYQKNIRSFILNNVPDGVASMILLRMSGTGRPRPDSSTEGSTSKSMNSPTNQPNYKYSGVKTHDNSDFITNVNATNNNTSNISNNNNNNNNNNNSSNSNFYTNNYGRTRNESQRLTSESSDEPEYREKADNDYGEDEMPEYTQIVGTIRPKNTQVANSNNVGPVDMV